MKTRMRQSYFLQFLRWSLLIIIMANPATTAMASDAGQPVSAQKTVSASAEIVPAHVAQLGFLISGIAREVPVKEETP